MRPSIGLLFALIVLTPLSGCTMHRSTTTDRTAIEQALLSASAEEAISRLETPVGEERTVFIDRSDFESVDEGHVLAALSEHFIDSGFRLVSERAEADLVVQPRSLFGGIDENQLLVGIPELPIIVPGAGTLSIPELALFKRHTQRGRHGVASVAINRENGAMAFQQDPAFGDKYYKRWTILVFLSFRTTNLDRPF